MHNSSKVLLEALISEGEFGHSSSLASFKVPSSRHASPSGFEESFKNIFPFAFVLRNTSDQVFSLDVGMLSRVFEGSIVTELEWCMKLCQGEYLFHGAVQPSDTVIG
jgi:hypothetical protein